MAFGRSENDFDSRLAGLQTYDAHPHAVERIRGRCLAALETEFRRGRTQPTPFARWPRWLVPAVTLSLSAVYLAIAFGSSLALLR